MLSQSQTSLNMPEVYQAYFVFGVVDYHSYYRHPVTMRLCLQARVRFTILWILIARIADEKNCPKLKICQLCPYSIPFFHPGHKGVTMI